MQKPANMKYHAQATLCDIKAISLSLTKLITRVDNIMDTTIGIVGLGYVGLPLAVEFGKKMRTLGFDISERKVASYHDWVDPTGEISTEEFRTATHLTTSSDPTILAQADYIIVAVPTPVDSAHNPNFKPLLSASETVGKHMKRGAIIIYESTVYPGATEEICIPVLESHSKMTWKKDFHVGFSPERINPGDKVHTLPNILKVVSGDDEPTLEKIAQLYEKIIVKGVYRASSIKVAEAAKVIENTQRDLNIALMNELAIIFDMIGIDTLEVLKAAGTKWNFLNFRPGLVGGHCIGVDPYYLTHKADMIGYHPQVILAGRRINDGMAKFIAEKVVKEIIRANHHVKGCIVNVMGITFKENCPDIRNSKVADMVAELQTYGLDVHVHDPIADAHDTMHEYGIRLDSWSELPVAQVTVAAVSHQELLNRPLSDYQSKSLPDACFIDIKSQYNPDELIAAGFSVWRL